MWLAFKKECRKIKNKNLNSLSCLKLQRQIPAKENIYGFVGNVVSTIKNIRDINWVFRKWLGIKKHSRGRGNSPVTEEGRRQKYLFYLCFKHSRFSRTFTKTNLKGGCMVPLSRGASFGADAECMSYFKAERTMASLNLFPRSEITKKKKKKNFKGYIYR